MVGCLDFSFNRLVQLCSPKTPIRSSSLMSDVVTNHSSKGLQRHFLDVPNKNKSLHLRCFQLTMFFATWVVTINDSYSSGFWEMDRYRNQAPLNLRGFRKVLNYCITPRRVGQFDKADSAVVHVGLCKFVNITVDEQNPTVKMYDTPT